MDQQILDQLVSLNATLSAVCWAGYALALLASLCGGLFVVKAVW